MAWSPFLFVLIWSLAAFAGTSLEEQTARLREEGYTPWAWQESDCFDCDVLFLPVKSPKELRGIGGEKFQMRKLHTEKTQAFLKTLSREKLQIMELYGIDGQDYNLLAHMAVGILGRESLFFTSARYRAKEAFPGLVRLAKDYETWREKRKASPSSRGPTQIKVVPRKIADFYGTVPELLYQPEHAAVATVGFLIEILEELKRRVVVNDLDFVNEGNYVDYLPYLYFGSRGKLIGRTATPDTNIYIRDMKTYMSWVEVFEGPRMRKKLY